MSRFFLSRFVENNSQAAVLLLSAVSSILVAGGVTADPLMESATSRSRYLMGTVCEVIVNGDAARADVAFDEIARVEGLISTWSGRSGLAAINRAGGGVASPELFNLVAEAMRLGRLTGGAFNPLVGPLVELWQTRADGALPAPEAMRAVLPLLSLDGPTLDAERRVVELPAGVRFEEGGFGKGYGLDRAAVALAAAGVEEYLIDFGGQLMIRSKGPVEVAIAHPERREQPAILLTMTSGSISTSSGSEKTFVVDGERFSHILDPRDGRALPPRGSVSVVSQSALEADALSTALYVMGPGEGIAWADAHGVAALFIVPAASGWQLIPSAKFNTSGVALRGATADFQREGVRP